MSSSRPLLAAMVLGAALLWLADRSTSRAVADADGVWDTSFFRGFGPYDAEDGSRPGDESAEIVIGGLWASSRVGVSVAAATAGARPQRVSVRANGQPAAEVRLGGRYAMVSFSGLTDADGVLRVRFRGSDGEPCRLRVSWLSTSQETGGRVPASRLLVYGLFLLLSAALARWASRTAWVAFALVTAASLGLAWGVSRIRLHVWALLPGMLLLLGATLAFAVFMSRGLRLPLASARWVAVGFALRLGFALHPAFPGGDALFHSHNVSRFREGLVLSSRAPNVEGREAVPVPYPPALYAVLAPLFAWRPRTDGAAAIRLVIGLLEGTAPLLVFGLMRAGAASREAAGAAAAASALMPEGVLVLGKGIAANVAGSWVSLLALIALLRRASPVVTTGLMALGFLTHFGAALSLGVLLVCWCGRGLWRREMPVREAASIAGLAAAALLLAFLVYYRDVLSLTAATLGDLGGQASSTPGDFFRLRPVRVGKTLQDLMLKFGGAPLLLAASGLGRAGLPGRLRGLLVAWFGAGGAMALLAFVTPIPLRFEYFLVPAAAMAAGLGAEELGRTARSRLVAGAWLLAFLVQAGLGMLLLMDRFELISVILESPRWPFPLRL